MVTEMVPGSAAMARPPLGIAGKITVGALVWLGLGALAGGIALVTRPDGGNMHSIRRSWRGAPFRTSSCPA